MVLSSTNLPLLSLSIAQASAMKCISAYTHMAKWNLWTQGSFGFNKSSGKTNTRCLVYRPDRKRVVQLSDFGVRDRTKHGKINIVRDDSRRGEISDCC